MLTTIPDYTTPIWHDGGVLNRDELKWGGKEPPPPIGAKTHVTINNCGPGVVVGYHVEENWLGLMVDLLDPPEWHRKQNKGNPRGVIFGPEYRNV